jgi:uncharacterized membrane protein YccC
MLQTLRQSTWRDGMFSLKTFVAAMLSLFIAFQLDLSEPSWSVTTVYIVSQPFSGMVLAKSLYRIVGTVVGAVMSLVFAALFSNTPELFCLALALWIGLGTFVTIYLRDAPQAYVGMLSGYSAAIIGLPAALAPDQAFDIAVARCQEIMLGIACGALMHHVVLPRRAGDALRKALEGMLPNMARWIDDALRGQQGETKGLADRRQILSAVVALDSLRVFASFDSPSLRSIDIVIRQFQGKLLSLLATLMSVYDRLAFLLRHRPEAAEALRPLLERATTHISGSASAATPEESLRETADEIALKADLQAHLPSPQALRSDADAFLVRSILLRLSDVLDLWREAVSIRTHMAFGLRPAEGDPAPAFWPYRDVTLAVVGGLVSVVTVLVASAFWIFSAWSNGPVAVTFAGIMCAIMGGQDNPTSASAMFLKLSLVGVAIAAFYLFIVLPPLDTFAALVVAVAPFYLTCGLLVSIPGGASWAMPMIFVGGALLGLSNAMDYDFTDFMNGAFSYVVGIGIGAAGLGLLRPLGSDWAVQRLIRGILRELADVAGAAAIEPRAVFESRMFDRINALFLRLDSRIAEQRATLQAGLAGLRIGLNVLVLRGFLPLLPAEAASVVREAVAAMAGQFRRAARRRNTPMPLSELAVARQRILAIGDDQLLIRTAEALYSIEMTLRQHGEVFGAPAPELPPATPEAVVA